MHATGHHLYLIQMAVTGAIKVGRSNDPSRRLSQLQTGCPYRCRLIFAWRGAGRREHAVHDQMSAYRTAGFSGEWFDVQALGELPHDLYAQLDAEALEALNTEWWLPSQVERHQGANRHTNGPKQYPTTCQLSLGLRSAA